MWDARRRDPKNHVTSITWESCKIAIAWYGDEYSSSHGNGSGEMSTSVATAVPYQYHASKTQTPPIFPMHILSLLSRLHNLLLTPPSHSPLSAFNHAASNLFFLLPPRSR